MKGLRNFSAIVDISTSPIRREHNLSVSTAYQGFG